MKHNFSDIEMAYEFVSFRPRMTNTAMLSRRTGRIYYLSELGNSDEDLPSDGFESDEYIEIPHKNDLDLGRDLVYQFIQDCAPDRSDDVRRIFSRKGAYSRLKELLRTDGLLDDWYQYEERRKTQALKEWCRANDIDFDVHLPGS